jgi:hypothetical protein
MINQKQKYAPFHPDHESLGHILHDFNDSVGGEELAEIFAHHGIIDLDWNEWYSATPYFDALNEIVDNGGAMMKFVSVGMKQVENAIIPPEYAELSIEELLLHLDAAYRMNNRGTDIGEIKVEPVSDNHMKMIFRMPHPDDIWYGVCFGYMKRLTRTSYFNVEYDDTHRRDFGADVTVIHIRWDDTI